MLDQSTIETVRSILSSHIDLRKYRVFIFGSRATHLARKFSDIDIGIEGETPLPVDIAMKLEEEFEQSDLPYMVDIVDFSKVSEKFRRIAQKVTIFLN